MRHNICNEKRYGKKSNVSIAVDVGNAMLSLIRATKKGDRKQKRRHQKINDIVLCSILCWIPTELLMHDSMTSAWRYCSKLHSTTRSMECQKAENSRKNNIDIMSYIYEYLHINIHTHIHTYIHLCVRCCWTQGR